MALGVEGVNAFMGGSASGGGGHGDPLPGSLEDEGSSFTLAWKLPGEKSPRVSPDISRRGVPKRRPSGGDDTHATTTAQGGTNGLGGGGAYQSVAVPGSLGADAPSGPPTHAALLPAHPHSLSHSNGHHPSNGAVGSDKSILSNLSVNSHELMDMYEDAVLGVDQMGTKENGLNGGGLNGDYIHGGGVTNGLKNGGSSPKHSPKHSPKYVTNGGGRDGSRDGAECSPRRRGAACDQTNDLCIATP